MQASPQMPKLKLGLVNIMPNAQDYEQSIHNALAHTRHLFDLYPIRLRSHKYRDSDLDRYFWLDDLTTRVPLDLLILTGAPVEHLPFEEVSYWNELRQLFTLARERLISTLGICFGGLAIAKFLGVEKRIFPEKCFGVHSVPVSPGGARYIGANRRHFNMALSTWALLDEDPSKPLHDGTIQTLARHPQFGPLVLATRDHKFVMVLGHPEYSVDNLFKEWQRDVVKDIPYTRSFNEDSFTDMAWKLKTGASPILANWLRSHSSALRTSDVL
jgi:homoserine O-succinyltransferase/O-acetyltransferase